MFSALMKLAPAPRLWLSAGVFCLGVSIVMGYHEDQMIAENTLAQKIAIPPIVAVQGFSSDVHENVLNEVNVWAEAALDRAVRVDVGNENSSRLLEIIPIYPVSRDSSPIINGSGIAKRRPVARADAEKVAHHNRTLTRVETVPVGLLVFEADDSIGPQEWDRLSLGEGKNGPLVKVFGVRIGATAIMHKAAGPLALNGVRLIQDSLVVSPYLNGRVQGNEIQDLSPIRHMLFWTSALMIAFGFASMFSWFPSFKSTKKSEVVNQVKAVGSFPNINPFQPIAMQDEIGDESHESPVRKVSRILGLAADDFGFKSRQ